MGSVDGALAAAVFLLLAVGLLMTTWGRWVVLTLLLLTSTFGWLLMAGIPERPLAAPLEQIRLYNRVLCVGLLGLLLVAVATSNRGWRRRLVAPAAVALLFFQL